MLLTNYIPVLGFMAAAALASIQPREILGRATPLNDLPVCAQQAGLAAIDATQCAFSDTPCICKSIPFLSTLRSYIESNCDLADQASALTFGQEFCLEAGITISAVVSEISTTYSAATASGPVAAMTMTSMTGTATSTIASATDASAMTENDLAMSTSVSMPMSTSTSIPEVTSTATYSTCSTGSLSTSTGPLGAMYTGGVGAIKVAGEMMAALAGVAGVMAVL